MAGSFGGKIGHAAKDMLKDAFDAICDMVQVETELPVFVGTPE